MEADVLGRDVGPWKDGNSTCSRESEISSKFLKLPAQYSIKYCRISTGSSWENYNEKDGNWWNLLSKNVWFFLLCISCFSYFLVFFFRRYFNYLECFVVHLCFIFINNWFKFYSKYYSTYWYLVCGKERRVQSVAT